MPGTTRWPWDPLPLGDVTALMAWFPARWWISGGMALELFAGRSWRDHDDVDVGICRADAVHLPAALAGWELCDAHDGTVRPWRGGSLRGVNVWCRRRGGPWQLDVVVGAGDDERWVYRRDPSLSLPWGRAVLVSASGVPFLAPELQLLFKAKDPRPKDHADAEVVVPLLGADRVALLRSHLSGDHPWIPLLDERR